MLPHESQVLNWKKFPFVILRALLYYLLTCKKFKTIWLKIFFYCDKRFYSFFFLRILFIYLAVLGLGCCMSFFLGFREQGLFWGRSTQLLLAAALPVAKRRLQGIRASGLVARRPRCPRGARAQVSPSVWDLLELRIEATSPALAGGFSTPELPGKPLFDF